MIVMSEKQSKYTLTVPLSPEDRDRLYELASRNYRKLTDQIRLLIHEAYRREIELQKKTAA